MTPRVYVLIHAAFGLWLLSTAAIAQEAPIMYPMDIEGQVWQLTNLSVKHFRNGDPIPQASTQKEWSMATKYKQPAWCYYATRSDYGEKYGILYNWYAVADPRELAPEGWHIPTSDEFLTMCQNVGCKDVPMKLRAKGEWLQDSASTNESGFSALPAGARYPRGEFQHAGSLDPALATSYESTAWWTIDPRSKWKAKAFILDHKGVWGQVNSRKGHGYSVRCIKNQY